MPRLVTMGKLKARCQRRADLEGDDHIDDEEWLEIISEAYGELYSIVAGTGLRYFERSTNLTTAGIATITEPVNVQSVIGIWYVASDGTKKRLRPIAPDELAHWAGRTGDRARRYELIDDTIRFYPTPPTGQTYELRYIPTAPDLSTFASDVCADCVIAEGEAFVIWGSVVKAKSKSESDVRLAIVERDRLAPIVREWAMNRLLTEPHRRIVSDIDLDTAEDDWP